MNKADASRTSPISASVERRTHGIRVGVPDREPEEDRADREAAESDEHPAACHLDVQFETVVRELVLVRAWAARGGGA